MRLALILVTFLTLTAATQSVAPTWRSEHWFADLAIEDRKAIQTDLVLTGDFAGIADGRFGPDFHAALIAYQTRAGEIPNGILDTDSIASLASAASESLALLGMTAIKDARSGVTADLPMSLLTVVKPTPFGTSYETPDGSITLAIGSVPDAGADLKVLARTLAREPGLEVTANVVRDGRLVFTGTRRDRNFYRVYIDEFDYFLGIDVTWTDAAAKTGQIAAAYAANTYLPTSTASANVANPGTRTTHELPDFRPYPAQGERVGPFLLPGNDESLIVLDGNIEPPTPYDFLRSLRKRPTATTLVLNSDGGGVDFALDIADQVAALKLDTIIPEGSACYSSCAYIFFAGATRRDDGILGVHQISGDELDVDSTQDKLARLLDALESYGVAQKVVSVMLRTEPAQVHVFTPDEVAALDINRSGS